jgi:hypothetical protein
VPFDDADDVVFVVSARVEALLWTCRNNSRWTSGERSWKLVLVDAVVLLDAVADDCVVVVVVVVLNRRLISGDTVVVVLAAPAAAALVAIVIVAVVRVVAIILYNIRLIAAYSSFFLSLPVYVNVVVCLYMLL